MTTGTRIVSAIDCGSTSIRCSIAQATDVDWTPVEDVEHPLDLLEAIRRKRFSRGEMDRILRAFEDILNLGRSYGVSAMRAVATPSLRDLINVDVLLERVKVSLGLNVELIDGAEEGRLYHQALSWVMSQEHRKLDGDLLLMDLGSSTSSVSWIRDGNLVQTLEEHVGTERLAYSFGEHRDDEVLANCLDRLALGASRVLMNRLEQPGHLRPAFRSVLMAGRGPREIVRLLGARDDSLLPTLSLAKLDETYLALSRLPPLERAQWAADSAVNVVGLISALSVMRRVGAAAGVDRILVPDLRLRIGLLRDFLPGAHGPYRLPREHLTAAACELSLRYGMDEAYSKNTAALAVQVFDATSMLHHLSDRERLLLELAALVHDVGAHISVRSRHKHSYYILQNVELSGLTKLEQDIIAHIARYHRGKIPSSSHEEFARLDRHGRMLVSSLAAILRVAYALDVERSQRIKKLKCTIDKSTFRIEVDVQDVALERWSMARKSNLFKSVFGLNVQIVPEQTARRRP